MSKKSNWPDERVETLRGLVSEGFCRREIARRMESGICSITTKLNLMGIQVPLENGGVIDGPDIRAAAERRNRFKAECALLAHPQRFEDVTQAEAAVISKGALRSAPYRRQTITHPYSITGNSSGMCAP